MDDRTVSGKPLRILLIGARPPSAGGGAAITFEKLVQLTSATPNVQPTIIDTSRSGNYGLVRGILASLRVLWKFFLLCGKADVVSFQASAGGISTIGVIIVIVARVLFRKPMILRAFGGNMYSYYASRPKIQQKILQATCFHAEKFLLQTKALVQELSAAGMKNPQWYSNSTPDVGLRAETPYKAECKKFIFLGRITEAKGIDLILDIAGQLPEGVTIDLYGNLSAPYSADGIRDAGRGKVAYKGMLSREDVLRQLWDYDALVLPTYWEGEGYPGVVLEAYAHGIPVITTDWLNIPEIVTHNRTGMLIAPKNASALLDAIKRLVEDQSLYRQLQETIREFIPRFYEEYWGQQFLDSCYELKNAKANARVKRAEASGSYGQPK